MPLNNAPDNLGQQLRYMERRIERLEAKYRAAIDNPAIHVPPIGNEEREVTSGSTWGILFTIPMASSAVPAVQIRLNARHTGTTSAIRLQSFSAPFQYGVAYTATATSDEKSVVALGGDINFDWLHGVTPSPLYDEWYLQIQGEVLTGAGSVFSFDPYIITQARSSAATTGG